MLATKVSEQDLLALRLGEAAAAYRLPFARTARGTVLQWDWRAALTPLWGGWWRITATWPLYLVIAFFGSAVARGIYALGGPEPGALVGFGAMCVGSAVLKGMFGTAVLHWHLRREVRGALRRTGSPAAAAEWLSRRAPRTSAVGTLTHGAFVLLASLLALFIIRWGTTYPRSANVGWARMAARSNIRLVHGAQHEHYLKRGAIAAAVDDLAVSGLHESIAVEMVPVDSVTFEFTARARDVHVVCRVRADVRQPELDEIPCARR